MGMKPNEFKDFLKRSLTENKHRAIIVSGKVGIGKSSCIKQVADELKWEFDDIRLSLLDAVDLRGVPDIDKEKKVTYWTKPIFLPDEDDDRDRILFFDEFSNASVSVQHACLQLLLDRRIGEYNLPENTRVVCAGNNLNDGAFVFKLSSAITNRAINIDFEPSFEDWKLWAYQNNINPIIISFHNYTRGDLLHNYTNNIQSKAFASHRSWTYVHELLKLGINNGTLYEAIKGAIGEGAGTEFYSYMKIYRDLPKAEDILVDNKDIIPEESSIMYALCGLLIDYTRKHKEKIDRLIKYSMKIQKEFSVVLIKDLIKTELRDDVMRSEIFRKWVDENKEVINL